MIFQKSYDLLPVNFKEVYRYAKTPFNENKDLFTALAQEANNSIDFRVCYTLCDVRLTENGVDFGVFGVSSLNLKSNLKDCQKCIIFAATIGVGIDRLIMKYGKISPSKSVIMQAIGSERVETLCDTFCEDIIKDFVNMKSVPRFSCGYGDLPLECQRDIFSLLQCEKNIGITLNDKLFMMPSKSVTAFMGLKQNQGENR